MTEETLRIAIGLKEEIEQIERELFDMRNAQGKPTTKTVLAATIKGDDGRETRMEAPVAPELWPELLFRNIEFAARVLEAVRRRLDEL